MKLSYYTIDDLRQGPCGWQSRQFQDWYDALEHYRWLPSDRVKALGVGGEDHTVDLFRCVRLNSEDCTGVNALMLTFLTDPLWQSQRETLVSLASDIVHALNVRYCLEEPDSRVLWPAPRSQRLPKRLNGIYLWGSGGDGRTSAIQWIEAAGVGWLTPISFDQRYPRKDKADFCFPLVTRVRADGLRENGSFVQLEITPWEYHLLEVRTRQRLRERDLK